MCVLSPTAGPHWIKKSQGRYMPGSAPRQATTFGGPPHRQGQPSSEILSGSRQQ